MKRFITATLTLALITVLSSGKTSAQGFRPVPSPVVWLTEGALGEIGSCNFDIGCNIDLIVIAAIEAGIIDPSDCPTLGYPDDCPEITCPADTPTFEASPQLGGQEGEDINPVSERFNPWPEADLWFELVDAGYTEDEAFDLVEMVIGEGLVAQLNGVDVDISNCNSAGRMEWLSDIGNWTCE